MGDENNTFSAKQRQQQQQQKITNCDDKYQSQSNAEKFKRHNIFLDREMYDKILRHRHTIEAHLGATEDKNGGRDTTASLEFDDVASRILVTGDSEDDLEKASRIICKFLDEVSTNDLGLTDLTSESLMAKMAEAPKTPAKVPLGNASSWDAATGRRIATQHPLNVDEATKVLLSSPLPSELCFGNPPNDWLLVPSKHQQHSLVTRAASDSFVPTMTSSDLDMVVMSIPTSVTISDSNRRKLESEDSSYGSDHENQDGSSKRSAVPSWNAPGQSNDSRRSHDDISRTTSETLSVEFSEYINKDVDQYECLETLLHDKNYENKVMFALRLGYTEQQLQRAVLKLGRKAGEDQILEELIRLQKITKSIAMVDDQSMPENEGRIGRTTFVSANESCKKDEEGALLPIIIDGSNVAMSHGNKERFSCKGIKICVEWFRSRGHKEITVFVPLWRKESSKPETPITDQGILTDLEKDNLLSFTPSRQVLGKRYVCHDDRYILNLAAETGGIVVSNDNYRELINEKPKFKEVIEERILMYSFVNDRFMPPDDPLGRNGPTLDQFLRKKVKPFQMTQPCPYGKKCTYGNKCKFFHADRTTNQKSITEKLKEHSSLKINEVRARVNSRDSSPGDPLTRTRSMQSKSDLQRMNMKQPASRTRSLVPRIDQQLGMRQKPQWPMFDTSMPPPAPRGPWTTDKAPMMDQEQPQQQNTHKKISRQFSVNPTFDPRIHCMPPPPSGGGSAAGCKHQDFSYPPPPFPNHMSVTRNASAPEQQPISYMQHSYQHQRIFHQQQKPPAPPTNSDMHLHKTMSWSATTSADTSSSAVSPLIGLSAGGVWDSQRPADGGDRSKLYYHLASLFPEDKVRRAMASLPDETDPEIICTHILYMDKLSN